MTDILIVSKTRMRGAVCVGAHDLSDFRSLRLHRPGGTNQPVNTQLNVGDVWSVETTDAPRAAPHVEDVFASALNFKHRIDDLGETILARGTIWRGAPGELFEGCLVASRGSSGYVPLDGSQPSGSTGYWLPGEALLRNDFGDRPRFRYGGASPIANAPWVGVADPPDQIPPGTLVRVSLSRPWGSPDEHGSWLQISGVY